MKAKKNIFLFILFIAASIQTHLYAQGAALNAFVQSSNLKYAGVGVKVVDIKTGKTICSHNENTSYCPASTLKLLTTASALEILGNDYLYKTIIYSDGTIDAQGILRGNIYIKGVGDPTLGSEYVGSDKEAFLKEWLAGIRKVGIKQIDGSIIALDGLFGYEGVSHKWLWEDLGNYFASGTYGISVFDNTYRLYLNSGAAGTTPSILRTDPEIKGLTVENNLKAANNNLDSAYIYGMPFSYDRRLYGTIPQNKTAFVIKGDIPDPGMFLASYFTSYLQRNGIKVSGKASTSRITEVKMKSGKELAITYSKSLAEIIRITNVKSNNHYAEHLFHTIIQDKDASEIKAFWQKKGIDTKGLNVYDGSGLATTDAISAALLTDILIYMNTKSKASTVFFQSLPTAGKEGTVASFLKDSSLEGKAKIKSGSMSNIQSYAGYIEKDGKMYAFAIIVNNFTGKRSFLKSQIEKLILSW